MLTFGPVRFSDSYETLAPEAAWRDLAARLGKHLPNDAYHPRDPNYTQAQAASDTAYEIIKAALENGNLASYAAPAGAHTFFSIPAEYWVSTASILQSKIVGNTSDEIVPEPIIGMPVIIRGDDWKLWVERSHPVAAALGKPDPMTWNDFPDSTYVELETLTANALLDEWWTWPEAIAWVGSRDTRNIATLRHWATLMMSGGDADIVLGVQRYLASQWCVSDQNTDAELLKSIERGCVGTIGRPSRDAHAAPLAKEVWRGGTVVYSCSGAQLVSAKNKLNPWAFDIAVHRADLIATFPFSGHAELAAPTDVSGSPANLEMVGNSTGAAEMECKLWLADKFAADPDRRRNKGSFRTDALAQFQGRLSHRGFNDRVWPELARKHGRNSAGAKKKSKH